jgi:hypothetical protein
MNLLITITRKTMCAVYHLSSTGLASLTKWNFKVSPFCHAISDCRLAIILPGFLVTNLAGEWVSSEILKQIITKTFHQRSCLAIGLIDGVV